MNGPQVRPWHGLAVAVSADRALIGPEAAALMLGLLAGAERVARRDGIALSPQLRHLREVLRVVAASDDGHADVPDAVDLPLSDHDQIDTREAARMLGLTPRQVRRQAAAGTFGPVRHVGRGYLISRVEVDAHATHRRDRSA